LTLWLFFTDRNICAQSETPKVEVGARCSLLRLRDFDVSDLSVGGRITYNLTDNIGLEGELNFFFPRDHLNNIGGFGQIS